MPNGGGGRWIGWLPMPRPGVVSTVSAVLMVAAVAGLLIGIGSVVL